VQTGAERMMRNVVAILMSMIILSACGLKGPLYLPPKPAAPPAAAAPAPNPAPAPASTPDTSEKNPGAK